MQAGDAIIEMTESPCGAICPSAEEMTSAREVQTSPVRAPGSSLGNA